MPIPVARRNPVSSLVSLADMILLRKLEPTDLPYLYRWENDASQWADSDTHNPLSQQDLRDYIASTTGDIYRDGQLRMMVVADGETVGCIDLFDFDVRNRRAAVGIYIAPECRGRGYGRQALQLVEDYAFAHLYLRLLYAVVLTRNVASNALFSCAGYAASSPLVGWTVDSDAVFYLKPASLQ